MRGGLVGGGGAGVDGPDLAALGVPVPDQVLGRLAGIVGDEMDVTGVAGSAHPDIAEFSAAAVGEHVGDVDGGALRAVNCCRVSQGQAVGAEVVGPEGLGAAVVHAGGQTPPGRVDSDDGAALGGDRLAAGSGGQGDDPVAGLEGPPVDAEFRSGELPRRRHRLAGPGVEGGHIRLPPGVHGCIAPGGDICGPGGDHAVEGLVPVGSDADPVVGRIPVDGGLDVPGAQLGQRLALLGVGLADVVVEGVHGIGVAGDDGFEGAARADRTQLAVIAHHHDFRSSGLRRGQQAQHGGVVGHPGLIQNDHRPSVEMQASLVEPP